MSPSTEWKCAAICSKRCGAVFSICIPRSRAQKVTAVKCVLYPESFQNCRQEYRGVQKYSQTTAPTRGAGLNPGRTAWRGLSCGLVGVIMRQRKVKGTREGDTRSSTARPPSSATTVRLRQDDATAEDTTPSSCEKTKHRNGPHLGSKMLRAVSQCPRAPQFDERVAALICSQHCGWLLAGGLDMGMSWSVVRDVN